MPTDKPVHIRDILPAVTKALKQPRELSKEIKTGLLAEFLARIDEEMTYSKRRETPRKKQYLARGRARGLVEAMGIFGILNDKQLLDWIGYLEGCVHKECLLVDHEMEEQLEILEYFQHDRTSEGDDDKPKSNSPTTNSDEPPF